MSCTKDVQESSALDERVFGEPVERVARVVEFERVAAVRSGCGGRHFAPLPDAPELRGRRHRRLVHRLLAAARRQAHLHCEQRFIILLIRLDEPELI